MKIELTKELIKEQVNILRQFLKNGAQDISQSASYEVIAKMYGYENWNILASKLNEEGDL